MKYSKLAIAVAFSSTTLFLAACGSDSNDNNSHVPSSPGSYVSEVPYELDTIDEAASITVMNYKMPNVLGEMVETSALVMFPKTAQPKDGYRTVVWAHGTVGVADKCAPSQNELSPNFKDATAKNLLAAGYVIVAPDYEGLGGEGIHPYLHIPSEAQSAIYAVKAVNEHYADKLNGQWMSTGQSQGGQASLGIAEFANADRNYKGAVAAAPASSLDKIILEVAPAAINTLPQPVAVNTYATLLSYAALAGAGVTAYEPTFDYRLLFKGEKAKELSELAETECLGPMISAYQADIQAFITQDPTAKVTDYPGIDENELKTNEIIQKFLTEYSQPTTDKLDKPILIIQGYNDTNVPYQVTYELYKDMIQSGTRVELALVSGAGHTEAIVMANDRLVNFVKDKMPAQ